MPRTTARVRVAAVARSLIRERLDEIENLDGLLGQSSGREFKLLIEQEYLALDGPRQHPEDQPFHRELAGAIVGYRLGLAVGRMLAGGAR